VSEGNNFKPYSDRAAWAVRVRQLRQQALVANGLWPLPEKCPLNATVTRVVDRGDYVIENVYFESYPGFYVTGSLFRPKGKGPFPAVLNAHGHAKQGRLETGNLRTRDGQPNPDPFPYQARGVGFARLGCIAFLYDMVGYAESQQVRHPTDAPQTRVPEGTDDFEGMQCELHCLSTQGLQTWNSIRAIDYLLSRADVAPNRIAVTGASGGATQTLALMMTDDRLAAAAPVCMVSPGFQGDCTCEQCALAKLDTDTVECCAAFAPKPLIVVGATGDWTKEIIEHGGPQIRQTYELLGVADHVDIVRFEAPHNYNRRSREAVYAWLNQTLRLGRESTAEQPFEPIPVEQLKVFTKEHPRPAEAVDAATLKKRLIAAGWLQLEQLRPTDAEKLANFRNVVGTALQHMVGSELPMPTDVVLESRGVVERTAFHAERLLLSRRSGGEQIPAMLFRPREASGAGCVVVHPQGKAGLLTDNGEPDALLAGLLDKGQTVLAIDTFLTGESQSPPPDPHIGFFACFNRTLLAQGVHDILTAIAGLRGHTTIKKVHLVGLGEAGSWCLLARGLCGDTVNRTAVEIGSARFQDVHEVSDPLYLPGALKYGDLPVLAALAAPGDMLLSRSRGFDVSWLQDAYRASQGDGQLRLEPDPVTIERLLMWLN
jgi:dienelactone hydrolase